MPKKNDQNSSSNSPVRFADVALALPVPDIYTYEIPVALMEHLEPGTRVLVPFGNRSVTGYVLDLSTESSREDCKQIFQVLDDEPMIPETMIPFFRWISNYYFFPIGEVIRSALPGGVNVYELTLLVLTDAGRKQLLRGPLAAAARKVMETLLQGPCLMKDICTGPVSANPAGLIRSLVLSGWIEKKRTFHGGRTKPKMMRFVSFLRAPDDFENISPAGRSLFEFLIQQGETAYSDLRKAVPSAPRLVPEFQRCGWIRVLEKPVYRDPFGDVIDAEGSFRLSGDQEQLVTSIEGQFGKGYKTFLLHGITGSGKTEIYMHLVDVVLQREAGALVLVPEIALISQMERRFRSRYGDQVAVLHSGLSDGERYDQWMRIRRGEAGIAIGTRSAVFAPFDRLGLIIVDEEHDTSYKQESGLRYHARDLAVVRAKMNGCVALLGSATPSLESTCNADRGKYEKLRLHVRYENRPLAEIRTIDLRCRRDERGYRRYISPELYTEMKKNLEQGEQSLLFLNRRGFSNVTVCGACGEPVRCRNCDISMTYHQQNDMYQCHYCGFFRPAASPCTGCGAVSFRNLGFGTEKLETVLTSLFPDARLARMDRDTTRRKGSVVKILRRLRNGELDILIGTQMVAKGHDFPNITLVGIICADLSLNFPDFRAGERTFQLLAQVAGRAGRGNIPGRVILQTYNPEHFAVTAAKKQDHDAFCRHEVAFRKALAYPPFSRLVRIGISGKDSAQVAQVAKTMGTACRVLQNDRDQPGEVDVLGPIAASLARIAGRFRWQILLKSRETAVLARFIGSLQAREQGIFRRKDVQVVLDVDPYFMM